MHATRGEPKRTLTSGQRRHIDARINRMNSTLTDDPFALPQVVCELFLLQNGRSARSESGRAAELIYNGGAHRSFSRSDSFTRRGDPRRAVLVVITWPF